MVPRWALPDLYFCTIIINSSQYIKKKPFGTTLKVEKNWPIFNTFVPILDWVELQVQTFTQKYCAFQYCSKTTQKYFSKTAK